MAKQIVKFLKTHGRYVRGDVAGFDQATIARWPKGTCKDYDPNEAEAAAQSVTIGALDLSVVADGFRAELEAKAAELEAKAAELEAREMALWSMEAEASQSNAEKPSGEPPKQGDKS